MTASVAADAVSQIQAAGLEVDEIDLYRGGIDPTLHEVDEPDWVNLDKRYSPEVMDHIRRASEAGNVVFVFPVWWFSMPAMMKGYIDRVWNHGYFYGGGRRVELRSVLWIGLAGDTREAFRKRDYDEMMDHHLNTSIAGYCGAEKSELVLLYNTLGDEISDMAVHVEGLREEAKLAVRRMIGR